MCAISCAIVLARVSSWSGVAAPRKIIVSRKVTQPGFSIAPALNSGHEGLVVLPERVADAEQPVVVVEARPGWSRAGARPARVEVRLERAPRVDAQRDAVVLGAHGRVGAGAHRDEVRRERQGGRQLACRPGATRVAAPLPRTVQSAGARDGDGVGRLEVGLVEAGEDASARRRGRGGRRRSRSPSAGSVAAVQALPVVAVGHRRASTTSTLSAGEAGEREPAVGQACRVERRAVERHRRAGPAAAGRRTSPPRASAAVNRIVVREPKSSAPRSRSRSTSTASTRRRAARAVASVRVSDGIPPPNQRRRGGGPG